MKLLTLHSSELFIGPGAIETKSIGLTGLKTDKSVASK